MTAVIIALLAIVLIILLYLFLVFPAVRNHKDLKILNGLYIAHRGLHNNDAGIPENSLDAFKKAVEYGFAIENDIHLTKDKEVVVFHDDTTARLCGVNRKICEMTLSEIRELRLLGTDKTIPTLKECLDVIDAKVPLLIEFKKDGAKVADLCSAAEEILNNYKGKYFIQSFHPQFLFWYRKHNKSICRGQLSSPFKNEAFYKKIAGCLLFNFISRPDFVSYEYTGSNYLPRKLVTKLGAFPVGWTFKSQKDIDKRKGAFKAFIFENFIP